MSEIDEKIKDAIEKLVALQKTDDTEIAHHLADEILCSVLTDFGQNELVTEYQKIEKWFA